MSNPPSRSPYFSGNFPPPPPLPPYQQSTLSSSIRSQSQSRSNIDRKAELFSFLQTASFLKARYDAGRIAADFYFRNLRYFHQQLTRLQTELIPYNLTLLHLVDKIDLSPEVKSVVALLSSVNDYQYNTVAKQWQLDPYQLAAGATTITSHFITLLDYLRLVENFDYDFLMELILELHESMTVLHAFAPFVARMTQFEQDLPRYLHNNSLNDQSTPDEVKATYKVIEDLVFTLFQEFKQFFV